MTTLEVTHSLTAPEIDALVAKMLPRAQEIADYGLSHRARLVKPVVSFDAQAFALSFLPAAGEPGRSLEEDRYSYHQLRKEVYALTRDTGVQIGSRYVVPSAHLTLGRYITAKDVSDEHETVDADKMQQLVSTVDRINAWLVSAHWPREGRSGCQWVVGQERGFTFRKGRLWYGGGESVLEGAGF